MKNKGNLCKNILEIFPHPTDNQCKLLVPTKCKYDDTLQEKAFIVRRFKSEDEPYKLFEYVETKDLNEALEDTKKATEKKSAGAPKKWMMR